MNKIIAIICISVYTFLIFIGATTLISASSNKNEFKDYKEVPYNDELYVNVQVMEDRESKKENENNHEALYYDTYFVVTKKNVSDEITDLYAYLTIESNGKLRYTQTSYSTSIKATYTTYTYYRNTTMSLLNTSNKYAYKEYIEEDEKEKVSSVIPETYYVRLEYNYKAEGTDEIVPKILKYKYDAKKIHNFGTNVKGWSTTGGVLTDEECPYLIEMAYSKNYKENNEVQRDMYRMVTLDVKDSFLGEETIKSMSVQAYAEINNKDMIDKGFDKYVKLFDYNGSGNTNKPKELIDCQRQTYLANEYNVEKIYFVMELTLSNGKKYKNTYYTTIDQLPSA